MSEETESGNINVRKLISIYEKKVEPVDNVDSPRPRARSVGHILNNEVIVRYNEYYTLNDIKEALEAVEESLGYYTTYDKQRHVDFQEKLFNILTGVIGINDEDPAERKALISKTQSLVSNLNQKLPNNRKPEKEENGEETDSVVSVKRLRQHFVPKDQVDSGYKSKIVLRSKQEPQKPVAVPPSSPIKGKEPPAEEPVRGSKDPPPPEVVSVKKLRNLFEEKGKTSGLQAILDAPRTFQYEVKIPYTEGNLGKYRLYRANSGNYLNYPGLIQNVDINRNRTELNRSKSLRGLDEDKLDKYVPFERKTFENSDGELSDDESDTSSESVESVKEAKVNLSSSVQVRLGTEHNSTRTFDTDTSRSGLATQEPIHLSSSATVLTQGDDMHSLTIQEIESNSRTEEVNGDGPDEGNAEQEVQIDEVHVSTPEIVETEQVSTIFMEDGEPGSTIEQATSVTSRKADPSIVFLSKEREDSSILLDSTNSINGVNGEISVDDEQLRRAEEEFEKLVQNNDI